MNVVVARGNGESFILHDVRSIMGVGDAVIINFDLDGQVAIADMKLDCDLFIAEVSDEQLEYYNRVISRGANIS